MAKHGTRYRIPRKVKKAFAAVIYRHDGTPKQRALVGRCCVIAPLGWRGVRKGNVHVAMGDTTTARHREARERERADF